MKKKISVLLACAMLFSICTMNGFAAKVENAIDMVDYIETIDYHITKTVNSAGQLVNKMERTAIVPYSMKLSDYSSTKIMLHTMGMPNEIINNLSEEDLELYATTPTMYSICSYFKTTKDGQTSIVTESEALAAKSAEELRLSRSSIDDGETEGTYEDSYMFICTSITDISTNSDKGALRFSTAAEWLTMPNFRLTDMLGITAQECTVSKNGYKAYIQYIEKTIDNGKVISTRNYDDTYRDIPIKDFDAPIGNGTYNGGGITFGMPSNTSIAPTLKTVCSNVQVYLQFNGHTAHPNQDTWFNVVGTYSHAKIQLDLNPSISFDPKPVGSLSLTLTPSQEKRNTLFDAHYLP